MNRTDLDRLSREYGAEEPREGRLARALRVDIPVWRQLGDEILADLDERVFGVGWWVPHPGTSRRILISDHLLTCVRGVETNLIEARLHLLEATDFWERENELHARAVSRTANGRVEVHMPERRRPVDDVQLAMTALHSIGVVRAIAGTLDCIGASIVGVVAVRTRLLYADLARAREVLARVAAGGAGERMQIEFRERLEAAIERAGPPGWLQWITDLRNMLIHRGRRLQMSELRPTPSGVVGPDRRLVISTDVIQQLPCDPGRSDVEMFLDAGKAPVLTESAEMTLGSVVESTLRLTAEAGELLVGLWQTRRGNPALLAQPREQWPDGPLATTTGFVGYAPGSMPYNPTQLRTDEVLVRRMRAASLGDAARGAWAGFD
jgi:hypothetical protein